MLKLTMNPRKRSKRHRNIPHRLRLPSPSSSMELDLDEHEEVQKETFADNVKAMIHQEATGKYRAIEYLSLGDWQVPNIYSLLKKTKAPLRAGNTGLRIDEYCREQIVEWSFRVVDYFRIDREVVAVSLSFLDRFLATCKCDRSTFKLAATTTLHLAVKLLYPCKLADLGILSDLSRGEFDMSDVNDMEGLILKALNWDLHPPTSIAFTVLFLNYFFASRMVTISSTDLDDVYDVSSFFCELAVCDYSFVSTPSSTIAIGSILNALEGMYGPENGFAHEIFMTAQELNVPIPLDFPAVRNRLWEVYERSEECALHNDKIIEAEHHQAMWQGSIFVKKASTSSLSPVSVSKPCHSASEFVCAPHAAPKLRNGSW